MDKVAPAIGLFPLGQFKVTCSLMKTQFKLVCLSCPGTASGGPKAIVGCYLKCPKTIQLNQDNPINHYPGMNNITGLVPTVSISQPSQ